MHVSYQMYEKKMTQSKKSGVHLNLIEIGSKGKYFVHHQLAVIFLVRQISISSFVLRTQRAVDMLDDLVAFANSVCLLSVAAL